MNETITFIYVTAYSPRFNNIASLRAEKLSKYLSYYFEVHIVGGIPDFLMNTPDHSLLKKDYNIGQSMLHEIPAKSFKKSIESGFSRKGRKRWIHRIKQEVLPILETFLPVSPGGMLLHDEKNFKETIQNIAEKERERGKNIILMTSYDPWFTLRIGKNMKKKYPDIIWMADFRDPPFDCHEGVFTRTPIARLITKKYTENSDVITVVSNSMKEMFVKRLKIEKEKIFVIRNGFDPEDIKELKVTKRKDDEFWIVYTGSLHPNSVDIEPFAKVLKNLLKKLNHLSISIKFVYAGKDSDIVRETFSKLGISTILDDRGMVPRKEALKLQAMADLLLLITYTGDEPEIGKGLISGKFYEYVFSRKPILVIGTKDWEMKEVVESDKVSRVFTKNQIEEMTNYLRKLLNNKDVEMNIEERKRRIKEYSYKEIAKGLYEILIKRILNKKSEELSKK